MRKMEFKMERTGLLEVGDILPVTEGKLPNSYFIAVVEEGSFRCS